MRPQNLHFHDGYRTHLYNQVFKKMKLTRRLDNRKIQNDLALISYLEMKKHVDRFILERNDYIHLMAAKEIGVD